MKSTWYFSALVFLLALFGISKQQLDVPNQEIVVQFADNEVTLDASKHALAIVKKQLRIAGVDHIQVIEAGNGRLKIAYYSDLDVAGMKSIFFKEQKEVLDYTSFGEKSGPKAPIDGDLNSYNLQVCAIQHSFDDASNTDGTFLEFTPGDHHFFKPVVDFSIPETTVAERYSIEKVAYILHKNNALEIDNSSHNIPEVRAGPLS